MRAALSGVKAVHAGSRAGGPEKAVGLSPKAQDSPAAGYSKPFLGCAQVWTPPSLKLFAQKSAFLSWYVFVCGPNISDQFFLNGGSNWSALPTAGSGAKGAPDLKFRTSLSASGSWD